MPEETVYLCERGNLDVRWPVGEGDGEGLPLSLQGCYASLVGREGVSLERYVVYAGLKRSGYIVMRAPTWGEEDDDYEEEKVGGNGAIAEQYKVQKSWGLGLFAQIYKLFVTSKARDPPRLGPMVTPGLYRSYSEPWDPFMSANADLYFT